MDIERFVHPISAHGIAFAHTTLQRSDYTTDAPRTATPKRKTRGDSTQGNTH